MDPQDVDDIWLGIIALGYVWLMFCVSSGGC
jgi:hypothetical protein